MPLYTKKIVDVYAKKRTVFEKTQRVLNNVLQWK